MLQLTPHTCPGIVSLMCRKQTVLQPPVWSPFPLVQHHDFSFLSSTVSDCLPGASQSWVWHWCFRDDWETNFITAQQREGGKWGWKGGRELEYPKGSLKWATGAQNWDRPQPNPPWSSSQGTWSHDLWWLQTSISTSVQLASNTDCTGIFFKLFVVGV